MATRSPFTSPAAVFVSIPFALWIVLSIERSSLADQELDGKLFEQEIAPLIVQNCLECHGASDPSGGLDLSTRKSMLKGGESGPAIAPEWKQSLLLSRITAGEMPPAKNGKSQALDVEQLASFRRWFASGSLWPNERVLDPLERSNTKRAGRDWWAWQPVEQISPPIMGTPPKSLPSAATQRSAIDLFVDRELTKHGMNWAPEADKRTLIRRVYFDLTGLPPSYDEIVAFEKDDLDDAYERVVDRLLESAHFGERWGRHWLDLVRFAETNGYERDGTKPNAWRYRDWVIRSINDDMPYNRFILEQLAGDELPDRSESTVIATGFLRLGTWDDEPNDPLEYQYERLEDMVHTTTTAFLAMTVKCARCHDHKFDAISQADYYRIGAAFWAGPIAHRKREWNGGPTKEELGFDVLGWTDLSRAPPELHLLKKGDVHRPLNAVPPGTLSGVPWLVKEFSNPPADSKTTLRRLHLAEWIAHEKNPLTARVIVNRLWQGHFGVGLARNPDNFGFLGEQPSHPELLDWLAKDLTDGDWKLKRIHKQMVMSQAYRQSSQHPEQGTYAEQDSANRWRWRADRRRLDSEQLRDAILVCSDRLDRRMGGPSFLPPINAEALEGLSMKSGAYTPSPAAETDRRSIYMFAKRSLTVPMMAVFDSCDSTAPTGRRDVSTVAPQALTLLNNDWVVEQSDFIAERVIQVGASDEVRINATWRIILGRDPSDKEMSHVKEYLRSLETTDRFDDMSGTEKNGTEKNETMKHDAEKKIWGILSHTLLNTNEFIYLD